MQIKAENLVKIYGDRTVVDHNSFTVNKSEVVGLLGPNGAGKTTTFYMVVGLVKPNGGKVFLDDKDLTDLTMDKRAKLGIGYLPQEASIFRKLTVEENIRLVLQINDKLTPDEKEDKLEVLLDEFGIKKLRNTDAVALSGGERRRAELARALAAKPAILLADEPTGNLDSKTSQDVLGLLKVTSKRFHQTIVMITHNEEIAQMADRILQIEDGKIVSDSGLV